MIIWLNMLLLSLAEFLKNQYLGACGGEKYVTTTTDNLIVISNT